MRQKNKNLKSLLFSFVISAVLFSFGLIDSVKAGTQIVINGANKYQTVRGVEAQILWNTTLDNGTVNGVSNMYGLSSDEIATKLMDDFGFHYIKVRIDDFDSVEPVNDDNNPLSFNWNYYNPIFAQQRFVNLFTTLRKLYNKGAKLHLSAFTAPSWMTQANTIGKKLNQSYPAGQTALYQEVAEIRTAMLVHLRDVYGVNVDSIVVWNEPQYDKGSFYCTQSELNQIVIELGKRFAQEGLTTKIDVPDSINISAAVSSAVAMLNNPSVEPYVGNIAYHTYELGQLGVNPDSFINGLTAMANNTTLVNSSREFKETEWAPTDVYTDSLPYKNMSPQPLNWAKYIYNNFVYGNASVVDSWSFTPMLKWCGKPAAPPCGGNQFGYANSNALMEEGIDKITFKKHVYVLQQYAKYIEPGSRRIDVSPLVSSGNSTPAVSAYLHPTSERLTIVAINKSSAAIAADILLQNLSGYSNFDIYRTSVAEDAAFIESKSMSGNTFSYNLPAESVTTFTKTVSSIVSYKNPYSKIEAEAYDSMSGIQTETCADVGGGQSVGYVNNNDYLVYKNVDFGSGAVSFKVRASSAANGGNIQLRLDSLSGALIGTCSVSATGGWQTWADNVCNVNGAMGTHDLYLVFTGGSGYLFNVNYFIFSSTSPSQSYSLQNFTTLLSDWLKIISSPADVNSDGVVNSQDLGIMMSNWQ